MNWYRMFCMDKGRNLIIRKAKITDVDIILILSSQLGYPATPGEFQKRFLKIIQDNKQLVMVAELEDNGVVGWIHVLPRKLLVAEPMVEVGGIVIDEKRRGQGIGKLLMASAEEWARSKGYGNIVVRSNIERQGSHDFYPSLGYTRHKTQHVYIKKI